MPTLHQLIQTENEHMRYTYGFAEAEAKLCARGYSIDDEFASDTHLKIKRSVHDLAGIALKKNTSATSIDVTTLKGYKVWSCIKDTIPRFGLEPLSYQDVFAQKFLSAMLPLLYAENGEWNLYQSAIREFHEVKIQKNILAIVCGRQMGKTTIVSAILAAIAVTCSGLNVMVISLGQRQSDVLKQSWMKCIDSINDGASVGHGYIRTDNAETSTVSRSRGHTVGDINQFKFVPSSSRGSRGQQAHLLVVDEAAFIRPPVYAELLLPLMSVSGCVTVCMSTPPKEAGFFTELLTKLDSVTGELIADVLRVELSCEKCRARGRDTCPHVQYETPSWQANTTQKRQVRELYANNANDRDRELSGVVVLDNTTAFNPVWIDAILHRRAIHNFKTVYPDALIMSIDPCGGGLSHAGVSVIGVCHDPSPAVVVVGGASINMTKADNSVLYHGLAHIFNGLRKDPRFSKCVIAVCIEGNYSQLSAIDIANAVSKLDTNIVIMSETRKRTTGEVVNGPYIMLNPHDGKERYVAITSFFLRTFRFRFCDRIFTDSNVSSSGDTFKQLLVHQMRNFMVETKRASDNGVYTKVRRAYSGKGSGGNDDACMALMMGIHQACIYFSSDIYSRLRNNAKPRILTFADDPVDRDYARIITESIKADLDDSGTSKVGRLPWNPDGEHARGRVRI